MQEIIDFLGKSPAFYVATAGADGQPRVRPFSFVMEWKGRLAFVTANTKSVYKQLAENPRLEICSFAPTGEWMRISGSVKFTDDPAAKAKVFEVMPDLKKLYGDNDPRVMVFWIEQGEAATYSFASMNTPAKVMKL